MLRRGPAQDNHRSPPYLCLRMHRFIATLGDVWHIALGLLTVLLTVIASGHVVLYKRDSRSAVAWVGLIWLVPVVGAVLYVVLGINRVRRRAVLKRRGGSTWTNTAFELERPATLRSETQLPSTLARLHSLAELVDRVTGRPLLAGNAVTPLENGEAAYPAMLAAIDGAERTVGLSTYIFDHDPAGRLFADALERAVRRGVEVLVLIDDVGARYSWPSMAHTLRTRGITVARFEATLLPWRWAYMNLRNHRKLLIVDGRIGFAGGMNIREGHMVARAPRHATQDLHFRIEGPVVRHLLQAFADDWLFTTGRAPSGAAWFPPLEPRGPVLARGITDGPDEDFERARLVVLGALACARASVGIVTPYFLPDAGLISALTIAAMRGVRVDIVLPGVNNQILVHWAATAQLWQLVKRGCRVYYTPPPFDHTKLMVVDGGWALVGSSNWDARSLRLNFEFDVECYDEALAGTLQALIERKLAAAREVTARELDALSLPVRLRNGVARLAAPYL
jgi:cardiolipin synthase A/B